MDRGTEAETTEDATSCLAQPDFLITQAPRPGVAAPTVSWTLSHSSSINQEDAPQAVPQATLVGAFSQLRFFLPRRLKLCEADIKLASIHRN